MINEVSLKLLANWENTGKELYKDGHAFGSQINTWSKEYRDANNKWFTNKDLENISYRTINYWDSKGYLTGEKNAGGKWRKFDLFQLIWIQVLETLRKMGVSHEIIIPAIFQVFGYIPETTDEGKRTLLEGLTDKQQKELLSLYGNHMNFQTTFRFYALYASLLKQPVSIRYYADGSCNVVKGVTSKSDSKALQTHLNNNSTSFISISINELIQQFISDRDIETISNISILSENELELLGHMRKKEVTEIKVFLEDGEPVRLDVTDSIKNEDLNKRVYEYILSPYQKIEFKTNGGKTAYFERTTIIKLNKTK